MASIHIPLPKSNPIASFGIFLMLFGDASLEGTLAGGKGKGGWQFLKGMTAKRTNCFYAHWMDIFDICWGELVADWTQLATIRQIGKIGGNHNCRLLVTFWRLNSLSKTKYSVAQTQIDLLMKMKPKTAHFAPFHPIQIVPHFPNKTADFLSHTGEFIYWGGPLPIQQKIMGRAIRKRSLWKWLMGENAPHFGSK
jgi:hypothetical protein